MRDNISEMGTAWEIGMVVGLILGGIGFGFWLGGMYWIKVALGLVELEARGGLEEIRRMRGWREARMISGIPEGTFEGPSEEDLVIPPGEML